MPSWKPLQLKGYRQSVPWRLALPGAALNVYAWPGDGAGGKWRQQSTMMKVLTGIHHRDAGFCCGQQRDDLQRPKILSRKPGSFIQPGTEPDTVRRCENIFLGREFINRLQNCWKMYADDKLAAKAESPHSQKLGGDLSIDTANGRDCQVLSLN